MSNTTCTAQHLPAQHLPARRIAARPLVSEHSVLSRRNRTSPARRVRDRIDASANAIARVAVGRRDGPLDTPSRRALDATGVVDVRR